MTRLLKTSFLWQFAGGFLIGAAAMLTMTVHDQSPATPAGSAAVATR